MPHTLPPRFLSVSALVAPRFFSASSRRQVLRCSHVVARWQEGLVGWGGSIQVAKNIPGEDLCSFPRGWDTGGFLLACFGAPRIVLAIPGFVSGERGEEMGSGSEREPSGSVMVASAEM